ncbi:hypothetical protein V8G54_031585 [Vigna mungo]|uniref:Uncharacterized protein n=1 Tax=Vigna mungo TaxID=3915 RepID=A0AAQ3MK13_VIGMU
MLCPTSLLQLSLEPLQAGDKGVKMVDGVIWGEVSGFVDAGYDGGHLLLDGAVVGTEGFFVVLERNPEELVLQLQRLCQLGKVRRRRRRRVGGGGDRSSGGVVAVGKGIHFHWGTMEKKIESQIAKWIG